MAGFVKCVQRARLTVIGLTTAVEYAILIKDFYVFLPVFRLCTIVWIDHAAAGPPERIQTGETP